MTARRRIGSDARTLAFVSTREGGNANIWLFHLRLLTHAAGHDDYPSFSPDGAQLS